MGPDKGPITFCEPAGGNTMHKKDTEVLIRGGATPTLETPGGPALLAVKDTHNESDTNPAQEPSHRGRWNTSVTFVPPKPNELLITASTRCSRATLGMQSRLMRGSFFCRLMVGGSMPRWSASTLMTASAAPAAPFMCPVIDLVEETATFWAASPKIPQAEEARAGSEAAASKERMKQRTLRVDWAELLKRTFDFDVFACVRCGGRLKSVFQN
jgi:hypothetical protein